MNWLRPKFAIPLLRWTLGSVVLLESIHAAFSTSAAHHFANMGVPGWAGRALGCTEIVAAILFLTPASRSIGGSVLLVVFAAAIAIHLFHGEGDIGGLIVYAAAVIACIAYSKQAEAETT